MIEVIYKEESEEVSNNISIKTPKNIKQIGDGDSNKKIYIEDYVMNFIKQSPKDPEEIKYGVLLGEVKKGNGNTYFFISGGLLVREATDKSIVFNGEIWTDIYEEIRRYFNHLEIVGWFATFPFNNKSFLPDIRKNHLDNFAGTDKVFFGYDRTENEEGFYLYESGVLSKQDGYYVYYERNESMQEYLIDNNISSRPEIAEFKRREGSYRAILNGSKEEKALSPKDEEIPDGKEKEIKPLKLFSKIEKPKNKKPVKKMSSLASSILIILLLVGAIVVMENYNNMKDLKVNMESFADNILGNKETKEDAEEANVDEEESVEIETVAGNVKPTEETTAQTQTTPQATTQAATQASSTQKYYTVLAGESLYKICRKLYNDTSMVQQIITLNNLSSPDDIYEGQKLLLPY